MKKNFSSAFTMVELLIVVIVIAILASITMVAYNGITGQAKKASVDSSLATTKKKVELFAIENGDSYPTSLSQVGIQGSDKDGSTSYRYTVSNTTSSKSYCITAINGSSRSYVTSTSPQPQSGTCPGHDDDGSYITNLVANPSFENSLDGWTVSGGANIERTAERSHTGSHSLRVTPGSTDSYVQVLGPITKVTPGYYTYSINGVSTYVGSTCGLNMGLQLYDTAGVNVGGGGSAYSFSNLGWSAVTTGLYNIPSGIDYVRLSIGLNYNETCPVRGAFYLDDALIIKGDHRTLVENDWSGPGPSYPNTYFDGDSPGWIWNGTPHASTSTGSITP